MDKTFEVVVGGAKVDQSLEFVAVAVKVDNPTNQWVTIDSIGVAIPQYTIGAIYPLPGTTRARFSFTAPPGQVNPPTIAGQSVTVTFYDLALPPTAGVGMLGGRAPYYDRNPTDIARGGALPTSQAAGNGTVAIWTYTVPAGRRAYVEMLEVWTVIDTGYANTNAMLETSIQLGATFLVRAPLWTSTIIGSTAAVALGANMEIQAADVLTANAVDLRAAGAGNSQHFAHMKATEFDQ